VGPTILPDDLSTADVLSLATAHPPDSPPTPERTSWAGGELSEESQDPLLGTTLHETYVVTRVLGAGGMGRVYEAHHTRIRTKRYAIKVLHSEFSLNPEIRLRFQREAEAAGTIEHDGVVGTYDIGETPQGWPYMVCEYLAGIDLNDYLKQHGSLKAESVAHIGRQLCSALGAAHARGVIHRDLKPHNIFVVDQHDAFHSAKEAEPLPSVKVLDFGLSRFVESDNELTKTGIILGTPGYMAPEQANGRDTDVRTDVYGIGALLFAAATGRAPFKEETPQLTVLAVMNREPPRLRDLVRSFPVDLEIVIQKAMARDPNERYENAGAMGRELQRLYQDSGPLNRRQSKTIERFIADPRLGFIVYTTCGLGFAGLACLGALLASLQIAGIQFADFHPSPLEALLLLVVAAFVAVPLGLSLRAFVRRTWQNSARVAELVPRIRLGLLAGLLGYGASLVVVQLAQVWTGLSRGQLSLSPSRASLAFFVVLPANAILAVSIALVQDFFAEAKSRAVRVFSGAVYPMLASLVGLGLLCIGLAAQRPPPARESSLEPAQNASTAREPTSEPVLATAKPPVPIALPVPAQASTPPLEASPSPANDVSTTEQAPKDDLAIASDDGIEALSALRTKYPRDTRVLKALVLAHASRADTLDQSAATIAELLRVDARFNKDTEVVFILKKALLAIGKAHSAASLTIKNYMGLEGAELLYQLMSEHPDQKSRLKGLFQELRKANHASPEVSIAYDLRYQSSCQGRLPLLERAEKYGDRRSLLQLQALSTAPKHCGWGRTCYPPCRSEAERFRQSVKVISRRLTETPSL